MQTDPGTSGFKFAIYIAAFVDLLRTSEIIRSVPPVPLLAALDFGGEAGHRAAEDEKRIARQLGSALRDLDSVFDRFFDAARQRESRSEWAALLKASAPNLSGCEIQRQAFSDGVVLFTEISDREHQVYFQSVFLVLTALSAAFLMFLYRTTPLRVGIGIGWGAEPAPARVFGSCIESSYWMESRAAHYPRLALHEDLFRFIEWHANWKPADESQAIALNRLYAQRCLELIFRDNDGVAALDYLRPAYIDVLWKGAAFNPALPAYKFIQSELNRFEVTGNAKLTDYYKRLKGYFDLRREVWDRQVAAPTSSAAP